jgi:hypothetical protein
MEMTVLRAGIELCRSWYLLVFTVQWVTVVMQAQNMEWGTVCPVSFLVVFIISTR